jgi:polar amino acid transport system substrate-binding protein
VRDPVRWVSLIYFLQGQTSSLGFAEGALVARNLFRSSLPPRRKGIDRMGGREGKRNRFRSTTIVIPLETRLPVRYILPRVVKGLFACPPSVLVVQDQEDSMKGRKLGDGLRWLLPLASVVLLPWLSSRAGAQDFTSIPYRLVVATRDVPPFAMKNADGQWIGISIDLLQKIKADLQRKADHDIELEFREMGLEEMLEAVKKGHVDCAAAALTVNYEREKRMDFSHPFYRSGLGIAVPNPQEHRWDSGLAVTYSVTLLKLLALLFAVLSVSGLAIYWFERKLNPEHFGGGLTRGIAAGIWWAAVTMTTVGYGDKVPRSTGGKVLGFIWMFAGLFIFASFTAAVTSALTVTQLKPRIAGPRDLSRARVATVAGSTSAKYLRSHHINARKYPDVRLALATLQTGAVDAVLYDAPILRHEAHRHFPGEVYVLPATIEPMNYAFALPTNSPLREQINLVFLREIARPEWRNILGSYLGEDCEQ